MQRSRSGVVLFITLSVIAAMLAMVGVLFAYLDKSRSNASYVSSMIEADLLFQDGVDTIATLLKKSSTKKEEKEAVLSTLYLAPVTLQAEEDDKMFTTLDCRPIDNGVNINWLGLENNSSAQHLYTTSQTVFDKLAEIYNIQNAAKLLSDLKTAIGGGNPLNTELQGRLEQKKGIISLSQLKGIVRDYRFAEDDSSVEKIEWENYFVFDKQSDVMEGNYLSAELIALLFDMEIDIVKEEWVVGSSLKEFVDSQGGDMALASSKIFAKEPIERVFCRVSYGYQESVYAMGFEYLEGKAEKFEFYGKQ